MIHGDNVEAGGMQFERDELDLVTTMESGQTFAWHRVGGENLYKGSNDRFYTTEDGDVLVLWQDGDVLHWRATGGMESQIEERLRLYESLSSITDEIREIDEVFASAVEKYKGLRVLNDDFLPCLVSYLCSVQMRIPRIKKMYDTLCREYGSTISIDGNEFLQFPSLDQLAGVTEQNLRYLGLGYRAEFVADSVEQLREGVVDPSRLKELPYEEAHDRIKQLHGVGDKVADCVLLFSCDKMKAFPVDTWIRKAVEELYPELSADDYHELGDNFREYIGEDLIGYAQEYLFHYARTADVV